MDKLPQIIYLVLFFIGALMEANRHGKKKEGEHNMYTSLIAGFLSATLLYWGGFFDNIF